MYMVMFVLDDPNRLDEVLDAWEGIGVSGSTIIESSGINRRRILRQAGTAYMAGINRLIGSEEEGHFTLFVIVQDEELVRACLAAVERVVGDLDQPNTGVLAAWPLAVVKGVPGEPPAR
jgi:nitrogen regulatory protein PII